MPPPSSYDWSTTHARQRGGEALLRLESGQMARRRAQRLIDTGAMCRVSTSSPSINVPFGDRTRADAHRTLDAFIAEVMPAVRAL
jgi:hypothetical protein